MRALGCGLNFPSSRDKDVCKVSFLSSPKNISIIVMIPLVSSSLLPHPPSREACPAVGDGSGHRGPGSQWPGCSGRRASGGRPGLPSHAAQTPPASPPLQSDCFSCWGPASSGRKRCLGLTMTLHHGSPEPTAEQRISMIQAPPGPPGKTNVLAESGGGGTASQRLRTQEKLCPRCRGILTSRDQTC